jgi:purine-binding chemotaxis protein CheW
MSETSPSRSSAPSGSVRSGGSTARPPTGSSATALSRSLCAFWIGERAYAVETGIVGEVLKADTFIPVPGTPPSVLGLFNLRGTPVSLVDLGAVLDLPSAPWIEAKSHTVLVLRRGETLLAGVLVDRMDLVVQIGQGKFMPRDPSDDNPVAQGFLEIETRQGLVLTVLDSAVLFQRLDRLKFR